MSPQFSPPAKGEYREAGRGLLPPLRFPEFRHAPAWVEKSLVNICERISQGGTPDTSVSDYWNGSVEWLTPAEMGKTESRFIMSTKRKITKLGLQNCSSDLLPINSVIISTRAPIGHVGINLSEMAINQGCKGLIPRKTTNPDFLYYTLTKSVQSLADLGAGNTFKELSGSSLKSFEVPFPQILEQQKIAECLSSVDSLIAAQALKVDALKAHKKGLMQQLFPAEGKTVPPLRFPEFRHAPAWKIKPLGEIGENLDNRRIPVTEGDRVNGEIPYYGASGVIDYINNHIFDEDILCISEDGANLSARVYPIAFSVTGKSWVNNHAHVLRFKNMSTHMIVEKYLNSIPLDDYLTGMAQPKLNRAMLDTIPIPLPDIKEQEKVANCLTSMETLIAAQTRKLDALKRHKKGLMQQLFPSEK